MHTRCAAGRVNLQCFADCTRSPPRFLSAQLIQPRVAKHLLLRGHASNSIQKPGFVHCVRRLPTVCNATAAAAAHFHDNDEPATHSRSSSGGLGGAIRSKWDQLADVAKPFSDPTANRQLLILCLAQALCAVALLIHDTYLPIYMQDVLGLDNTNIGNLQAVSVLVSNLCKVLSGTLADVFSPARMIIIGTLLTALDKPMFAVAGLVKNSFGKAFCLTWLSSAKLVDTMSKGVRNAPGSALIGELAHQSGDSHAPAFALRQATTTFGALVGAVVAATSFKMTHKNYPLTFALSIVPAAIAAVMVFVSFRGRAQEVEAQKRAEAEEEARQPEKDAAPDMSRMRKAKLFFSALKPAYWQALIVTGLQSLGWFDTTFHTLRAASVMSKARLPLITTVSALVQALLATSFGAQAKRSCARRNTVLLVGMGCLIGANAVFATIGSEAGMLLGALLLGLHLSMTDAVSQAMLSSYIPAGRVRGLGHIGGSVWSFTNLVLGLMLAYGNRVAGKLADVTAARNLGNVGCFGGGMVATIAAAVALMVFAKFGDLGKDELLEKKKA